MTEIIERPDITSLDSNLTENALEQRARRAARRVGLMAKKSRWRAGTVDNKGGFALVNPYTRGIVHGVRFNMSAEDVIEYCENRRVP